jgi:hypothetical protein
VPAEQDSDGLRPKSKNDSLGEKQNHERGLDRPKQEFDRVLERLDTFNHDVIHLGPHLTKKREQSKAYLLGTSDTIPVPPFLKQTLYRYAELYAMADSLAIYFRDRTVNTLLFLFSLFFIAVVCFNVFAIWGEYLTTLLGETWGKWLGLLFLLFYLVLLVSAYSIWYLQASRRQYQSKYLDYRALAEGVRVHFFWSLAGIPDSVALHYLRKQKSELDWIRNSIRVANLLCEAQNQDHPPAFREVRLQERYHMLLKQWVDDQQSYFTRASIREQRKLDRHERWVRRFFTIGIVLAVMLFLLQGALQLVAQDQAWMQQVPLVDLLIFLMTLAVALAALREGYIDKMAYTEQIKQYQRMSHLFQLASQHLKAALKGERLQEAERVILELEKEALTENGDWVLLHRARPINVPVG